MKILLIGSGGREHALYHKILQSPLLSQIKVFPGNAGIHKNHLLDLNASLSDLNAIYRHVKEEQYDLVVIGPEQPLVDGISDLLAPLCPVFGPSQKASRLEGSKEFSKNFMQKYNIPTAQAQVFTEYNEAWNFVKKLKPPIVIKADALAAGKGVSVCEQHSEAKEALEKIMVQKVLGEGKEKVLVEKYMEGQEISVFALCDGEKALPFIASQDHKRAYDKDQGPNTGGMGAYLPVPFVNRELQNQIQEEILNPTLKGMKDEGHPYRGLLYAGLMVKENQARVVEFNIRFGDPETQALLPLLKEDLLPLLYQSAKGNLEKNSLEFHKKASICVVLAAKGYPGDYQKNILLKNLDTDFRDIMIFHAGTKLIDAKLYSSGGRVLNIVGQAKNLNLAQEKVYSFLEKYPFECLFYRKDIGVKTLE